jgi:GT2 family glycosyltransferase
MKTPLVSVIIVNWNRKELLEKCLSSISCTEYPRLRVIVADNGSTDSSAGMVKERYPGIRLVRNRKNLGFSKANNQCIRLALSEGADYVLLLNNDTEIMEEEWLTRILELAEADKTVGIIGPRLVSPDGSIQISAHMISPMGFVGCESSQCKGQPTEVDEVLGAAFLIRRAVIERIGLLDEEYSPFYYEDSDYCMRAKKAGFKVVYYPSVTIVHQSAATTAGFLQYEKQRVFVSFKNMTRFRLINYPMLWLIPSMLVLLLGIFIERKPDSFGSRPFTMSNVRVHTEGTRILVIVQALMHNLGHLDEIVALRIRNRTLKRRVMP